MSTLEEVEAMIYEAREAHFQYSVAAVLRGSHMQQAKAIEETPMEGRTVAMLEALAHHRREIRAQERAMTDAVRRAQALEARANLELEAMDDDG